MVRGGVRGGGPLAGQPFRLIGEVILLDTSRGPQQVAIGPCAGRRSAAMYLVGDTEGMPAVMYIVFIILQ